MFFQLWIQSLKASKFMSDSGKEDDKEKDKEEIYDPHFKTRKPAKCSTVVFCSFEERETVLCQKKTIAVDRCSIISHCVYGHC